MRDAPVHVEIDHDHWGILALSHWSAPLCADSDLCRVRQRVRTPTWNLFLTAVGTAVLCTSQPRLHPGERKRRAFRTTPNPMVVEVTVMEIA